MHGYGTKARSGRPGVLSSVSLYPRPCALDDRINIHYPRRPTQLAHDPFGTRYEYSGVTWPPLIWQGRNGMSSHSARCFDNLEHAETAAVAEVIDQFRV